MVYLVFVATLVILWGWTLYDCNGLRRTHCVSALWPWFILFFPGVGALAYLVFRSWFKKRQGMFA